MVKYLNLLKQQVTKNAWQAPDYIACSETQASVKGKW